MADIGFTDAQKMGIWRALFGNADPNEVNPLLNELVYIETERKDYEKDIDFAGDVRVCRLCGF